MSSITHQFDQTLEISDLIQEFFVVLVALRLKELDFIFQARFLQFTERSHNFLVDFVNQINMNSEMAMIHDFVEKSMLEADFFASNVE